MATASQADRRTKSDPRIAVALVVPPFAWFGAQQLNFLLTDWACGTQRGWVLAAIAGVALVLIAACGVGAWAAWKGLGGSPPGEAGEDPSLEGRRLLAVGGVLLSILFFVGTVALGVTPIIHRPCD